MATNEEILASIAELKNHSDKRVERVENVVANHEKRISSIEDTLPIQLSNLTQAITEFKSDWGKWQKNLFILVVLLILIVAALAGVQQIPSLPF